MINLMSSISVTNDQNVSSTSHNAFFNLPLSMNLEMPPQPMEEEGPTVVREGWIFKRGLLLDLFYYH